MIVKRVNCLYRVSTKKQVDVNSDDIPMQKISCHEFASLQGWVITNEFSEKGVSGFKVSANDRDAIQDLKNAALNDEFDILLVFMFDRIGRIDDETPFVVEWFVQHGIEVWSVKEGEQRFDSHVDKLMNYIRFWQASGESAKTSMRIKTRMHQMVEEGTYTGGHTPFGYKLVKNGRLNKKGTEVFDLAIDEDEARYVRILFEKTVREGHGSHRLATFMNKEGIKTHNGSVFQSNTIIRILRNRVYTGFYENKNVKSPKIEELEIINEELFEQAQLILNQRVASNEEKREFSRNTTGKTLLSGNIFCSHCGGRIVSTSYTNRYIKKDGTVSEHMGIRYLCYHKSRKLNKCDGQAAYDAEKVDNAVLEIVRDMFMRIKDAPEAAVVERKFYQQVQVQKSKKKKLSIALEKNNKQLEKLQMEIANSLTGDSVYSAEDLALAIKTVKSKIVVNEQELAEIESEIQKQDGSMALISTMYDRFIGWANEFDEATFEQKKMIISQLIKRVELGSNYKIKIELDMDYEQFCYEWDSVNKVG